MLLHNTNITNSWHCAVLEIVTYQHFMNFRGFLLRSNNVLHMQLNWSDIATGSVTETTPEDGHVLPKQKSVCRIEDKNKHVAFGE
jgi:hypothetical protein